MPRLPYKTTFAERYRGLRMNRTSKCLLAVLLGPAAVAQDATQSQDELRGAFAKAGLTVDLENKTVALKAKMNRPADLLEYLLITRQGKGHEALLLAEVQPSVLNAALLALGLTPGTNVSFKEKDPLPSEEEVRNGVDWLIVTPPKGPQVWFTVAWKDAADKSRECALEDLVMDLATGEAMEDAQWIYIGGRMAEPYRGEAPVYIADLEGNVVSCCYLDPANHLVTLHHARARSDQNWWLTEACPEPGTELTLTIHTKKPKLTVAREERLAQEKAAGKKPKGPPAELPALPASSDNPPPVKRDDGKQEEAKKEPPKKDAGKQGDGKK
jgi:hypothetical protein